MNLGRKNKVNATFSMSSMTDIVFLLLIFFMLLSTLVSTNAIDLVLPQAKGKTTQAKQISVSITNKLKYYINETQVAPNELEPQLKQRMSGTKNLTLVIRAEENVPINKVVKVLDFANKNNLKAILATRPN